MQRALILRINVDVHRGEKLIIIYFFLNIVLYLSYFFKRLFLCLNKWFFIAFRINYIEVDTQFTFAYRFGILGIFGGRRIHIVIENISIYVSPESL